MIVKVTKAVFPVAGLGARFLPATKANPKEMLPIVDKPLIQYAVEEAIAAGIKQLVFVTSSSKRAIEDHFDSNYELESKLAVGNRYDLLALVRGIIPDGVSCVYVRQRDQLGLGHAVLCASDVIGDEPFAVLLADDLVYNHDRSCLQQMLDIYQQTENSVLAVEDIDPIATHKYGIVAISKDIDSPTQSISQIVEKPEAKDAPSSLAVVGRYLLTPRIFSMLRATKAGKCGEIQLTDAIDSLLAVEKVRICQFDGIRYDCGSKLGYLKATVDFALNHFEIGADFKKYLCSKHVNS